MLANVVSSALFGIDAKRVTVEVDVSQRGLPSFFVVGLPDTAVKESVKRVRNAITNSGLRFPNGRITVNLSPAGIKKEGPSFDLPIAMGILAATQQFDKDALRDIFVCGELSLDGSVKPLSGILPMVSAISNIGVKKFYVPSENAAEAALVKKIDVFAVSSLTEAVRALRKEIELVKKQVDISALGRGDSGQDADFSDVKGHIHVKRGLEVAAAGSHNVILIGPPGSGKTMLAKRVPTILPDMGFDEAIECTKIHSVAGNITNKNALLRSRPFRFPHRSVSYSGLIGGGNPLRPGEITLAHNGVLFLDEFPEFRKDSLQMLRQPMEDGMINLSRSSGSVYYPARFMLIAAMNPCPCGYFTHPAKECYCSSYTIQRYRSKITGPLLDRIDIHLEVAALNYEELSQKKECETSKEIKKRVLKAHAVQKSRYRAGAMRNAMLLPKDIQKYCGLTGEANDLLKLAMMELNLSGRAYDKILKLGRTIADLAEKDLIDAECLAEAIGYRSLDRRLWLAL